MDRYELCEALRAAGIPAGLYEIPGCPGNAHGASRYYLEGCSGGWAVGVQERGRRERYAWFPDEDAACRDLWARLTGPEPEPERLSAREAAKLAHTRDEIQRQAREDLERALRRVRREEPGGGPPGSGG